MFTIAGAKKKLQAELRENSKLKIVHPESHASEHLKPVQAPSLFDDDIEIDDLADDIADRLEAPADLNSTPRQALRSLAAQLLELREMLRSPQGRR
jgi:hypothetical protein